MMAVPGIAQTFQLGVTDEDLYKVFGVPNKWWAPEPGKHLNGITEYKAAAGVWLLQDVYERKTATNLYEIRAAYHADRRESRLHPKLRVTSVEFLVDKPGTFREMLADLAEAEEICTTGCKLYGIDSVGEYYILAYPSKPTPEQTAAAALAATGYKDQPADAPWDLVMAAPETTSVPRHFAVTVQS
jgi:hypothetical protein